MAQASGIISRITKEIMAPAAKASKTEISWGPRPKSSRPSQAPRGVKKLISSMEKRIQRRFTPAMTKGVAEAMPSGILCRPMARASIMPVSLCAVWPAAMAIPSGRSWRAMPMATRSPS